MDLSAPLASIVPSLDAEALTVLARTTEPLTGARVAALARRGSRPGVQATLERLARHGLVDRQPAGRATLYSLNREHLLAGAVETAVAAREVLLERLRERIAGWEVSCVHASLFGSVARGEATPESDIDILVVRADEDPGDTEGWVGQLAGLETEVHRWTGNSLSWFEITPAGLARAVSDGEPVVESWRADSIQLAGARLGTLLAKVQN